MTEVFVTRTGSKYHALRECPSFEDAQREHGRPIATFPRQLQGTTLSRCSVCWPLTDGYDGWRELALEVERTGDSPFEALLVERVLRQVPGLRPSHVTTQRRVEGASGRTYYADFILSPEDGHRVAIEVDGHDKAPGRKTPEQVRQESQRKRADLVQAGWPVVTLANAQVATGLEQCVIEICGALYPAVSTRNDARVTRLVDAPHENAHRNFSSTVFRKRPGTWIACGTVVAALLAGGVIASNQGLLDDGAATTPEGGECPQDAAVKGNVSQDGERIYHSPGWEFYTRTDAEDCFKTESDAEAAGYRASERQ